MTIEGASADDLERMRHGGIPIRFGTVAPEGWPMFPEAIPHDLERLRSGTAEIGWTTHFVIERATGQLIGSGGYATAPVGGVVEIGYEIAPAFRGRGLGRAAAAALIRQAFIRGVSIVQARTLPHHTPSSRLLDALDFVRISEDTETWTWELSGDARRRRLAPRALQSSSAVQQPSSKH